MMDPTKTMSYRRWRNRLSGKGFLGPEPTGDESYQRTSRPADSQWEAAAGSTEGENKLKMYCFKKKCDERHLQRLVKELVREYRKIDCFRKDKVANLKRLIKQGEYRVSGKAVVDKWFSDPPASESR